VRRRVVHAGVIASVLLVTLASCAPSGSSGIDRAALAAERIPEAFSRSTAALVWPGATRAFQITPAGDLYDGAWTVRIQPREARTGAIAAAPRVIAFEDRWLPVAHWLRRGDDIRWSFEAFAWPADGDTNLYVSLLVRADNETAERRGARLELTLAPPDSTAAFLAWDAPEAAEVSARPAVWAAGESSREVAGLVPGARPGADARTLALDWTLPPNGGREQRVVLSAYPRPAGRLAAFARVPHARRADDARGWWRREADRGTRFRLGDPDVEAALSAARITLLACRERRGKHWFPLGGPFQYRDVWLRDGARVIQALALLGYGGEARQLARGFASLQWPWGAFLTQRGQPDGTGQALWAFEQALLRPPVARDSLMTFVDAAARAWRWCEATRTTMAGLDPGRALMPFADPRDNELARAPLVGTDAWTLAGYGAARRLAAAAGRTALADSIERSRRAYAATFMAALRASAATDVPAAWRGRARDWGNVAALFPCHAGEGAPQDSLEWARRCSALAARLTAGGDGLVTYGGADSLHGYLGADLGDWALESGDRATAERALAALLHWRSASGGWAELFSRSSRDYGRNLPPHVSSAAAVIVLVRNALVMDDGPAPVFTAGAREAWWRGATVRGLPTRWATIDLEFRRTADAAEWTWTPLPVPARLRLPPGTEVASALPPLQVTSPTEVVAPPGTSHARVTLRAAAPAKAS
jgi:hypothetical protein